MTTLIDGEPTDCLPADDRGFLFGETVFETVAFRDGRAPLWELHMQRLASSAAWLGVGAPAPSRWLRDCQRIVPIQGRHVVRLTLSAGSGGQGYWPCDLLQPRRVVTRREWPDRIDLQRCSGLRLQTSSVTLPTTAAGNGHKHGNRLIQVIAARECRRAGYDEAVLLDAQGYMAEAISSNILFVLQGRLLAHPAPAVAGVGLNWLRSQTPTRILDEPLAPAMLAQCSEVLVINSVAGIRPVVAIDQHSFVIGPVCRHLQSLWDSQLI